MMEKLSTIWMPESSTSVWASLESCLTAMKSHLKICSERFSFITLYVCIHWNAIELGVQCSIID